MSLALTPEKLSACFPHLELLYDYYIAKHQGYNLAESLGSSPGKVSIWAASSHQKAITLCLLLLALSVKKIRTTIISPLVTVPKSCFSLSLLGRHTRSLGPSLRVLLGSVTSCYVEALGSVTTSGHSWSS